MFAMHSSGATQQANTIQVLLLIGKRGCMRVGHRGSVKTEHNKHGSNLYHLNESFSNSTGFPRCICLRRHSLRFGLLPAAMVVNTDPSDDPGNHWLAFFPETTEVVEGFDLYRGNLAYYGLLVLAKDEKITCQVQRLQAEISPVCGHTVCSPY